MEAALNQITCLKQAQTLLGKVIREHTIQQNEEVKSIINKDHEVAPKRMPLDTRLAVNLNTHNMGFFLVESVKNAKLSISPQQEGGGLENIFGFQRTQQAKV